MRDATQPFPPDPQIAHKLSCKVSAELVVNLWMNVLLLTGNEAPAPTRRVYAGGFLPTMKLQLSQLP
jgi:hypothetical protein